MAGIELTILMPCLNEAKTLAVCIGKAMEFIAKEGVAAEVLIADNGSSDGSQKIAGDLGARVVEVCERGYGAALYHGSKAARGRYIIMADADDSYDFRESGGILEGLRAGNDLVMGNRFAGGIRGGAMPWKNRYIGNPALSSVGRLLFRCPAKDFHCGFRGYTREAFDRMDLRTSGMEFASEMVVKATLLGMKVSEVPVSLSPDGRGRPPHLRPWRDGWRHLRFMFMFSPRWALLYPGIILGGVGAVGMLWLLGGPRQIGAVELDVNTLLYCSAMLMIGFQAVLFAVFARVFAYEEGLMPEDRLLTRCYGFMKLEVGLLVGAAMLLVGIALTVWSVVEWGSRSFGNLDPVHSLRRVIPAMVLLTLGVQLMLSSFFFSILGLRLRSRGNQR